MFYVQMAILIFILVTSVIASISYSSRRSQSKTAYHNLAYSDVIREATEQEKAALKPVLVAQKMDLSFEVYKLSGYYRSHGLESNSSVTEHHTIDDVEVFLPYDAELFLSNYNEAEVILGPTFAVVLTLNDAFDIATARERIVQQQLKKQADAKQVLTQSHSQQTDNTSSSLVLSTTGDNPAPITNDLTTTDFQQSMEVKELGERQETALEALERYSPWGLFWCFVAWLTTLIILGNSLDSNTNTGFIWSLIGILTTFGLFWFYRPARLIKKLQEQPKAIKNVTGQLNLLQIASPNNAHQINDEYFIGDEMKVKMPDQWRELPLLPLGRVVNADIRTEDNYLVRLGNWKIADEYQKFPIIYKGRYIFLMILGAISLFCYWLADGNPQKDIRLAKLHFTQQQINYQSTDEVIKNLPKVGTIISLSGKGKCLLKKRANSTTNVYSNYSNSSGITASIYNDCHTIHWGGELLAINNLLPVNNFEHIYSRDFLNTKLYSSPYNPYTQSRVMASFLQDPPHVVQTVENACDNGFPNCEALKQAVVKGIMILNTEQQPKTWQEFVEYTKTWKKDVSRLGLDTQVRLVDDSAIQSLAIKEIKRIWPQIEESLELLVNSQQGGIFITSNQRLNIKAQTIGSEHIFNFGDLDKFWKKLSNLTDTSFSVTGMVTHVPSIDNKLAPTIHIDPTVTLEQGWSGCNYSLWLLFSVLMLGYGTFMFFKLPSLNKHKKALKDYLATREYY